MKVLISVLENGLYPKLLLFHDNYV